jgi:hypothetical protein
MRFQNARLQRTSSGCQSCAAALGAAGSSLLSQNCSPQALYGTPRPTVLVCPSLACMAPGMAPGCRPGEERTHGHYLRSGGMLGFQLENAPRSLLTLSEAMFVVSRYCAHTARATRARVRNPAMQVFLKRRVRGVLKVFNPRVKRDQVRKFELSTHMARSAHCALERAATLVPWRCPLKLPCDSRCPGFQPSSMLARLDPTHGASKLACHSTGRGLPPASARRGYYPGLRLPPSGRRVGCSAPEECAILPQSRIQTTRVQTTTEVPSEVPSRV